jgi:hypothetical protein
VHYDVLALLGAAFVIGMSAAGLPPILRALPPIRDWVMRGIKPWACDICMSFWSTLLAAAFWKFVGLPFLAAIPAYVVTLAVVRLNSEHIGPPPGLPELEDSASDSEAENRDVPLVAFGD